MAPPVSPDAEHSSVENPLVTAHPAVRYTGVHHIALATNHMERTIRFYRDLLGFKLTAAMGEPGFRHYFFSIDGANSIAFFEWPDVEEVPRKPHGAPVVGPFNFDHLAFGVASDDDLWEIKDRLEAADFDVSEVVDHGICHSLYTYDPSGIPIEFAVPTKAAPARVIYGDAQALPAAREGADPQVGQWPTPKRRTPKSERRVFPGVGSNVNLD